MKSGPLSSVCILAIVIAGAVLLWGRSVRADVVLLDKDGWSVWTSGRSAAHYQFIFGQGTPAPSAPGVLLTGFGNDAAGNNSNDVATSRIRSGWGGAQLNFGVANQVTPELKAKTYFSFNVADITNDREKTAGKGIDIREAYTSLEGSFGTVIIGRALSIFGTALAGSVYMYSYGDGVGHPCSVDCAAYTCGPVTAGARVEVKDLRVGVGFWGGKGMGSGVPMQSGQAVDPTGQLRGFLGYMAHALYRIGDSSIGAGFGESLVSQTPDDENTALRSL